MANLTDIIVVESDKELDLSGVTDSAIVVDSDFTKIADLTVTSGTYALTNVADGADDKVEKIILGETVTTISTGGINANVEATVSTDHTTYTINDDAYDAKSGTLVISAATDTSLYDQ